MYANPAQNRAPRTPTRRGLDVARLPQCRSQTFSARVAAPFRESSGPVPGLLANDFHDATSARCRPPTDSARGTPTTQRDLSEQILSALGSPLECAVIRPAAVRQDRVACVPNSGSQRVDGPNPVPRQHELPYDQTAAR